MAEQVLRDLGERRLIEEVLRPRYDASTDSFGDDCASLLVPPGHRLVVTTDPCPQPMAELLGFNDPYYRGWLLATINLSDLAAAGALPLGLLTSLVLEPDMPISSLVRLLDGIDDCCRVNGTRVIGGNLKEGKQIDVQATAFGCVPDLPLSRVGARPGDVVALAGPAGEFWAGALSSRGTVDLPEGVLDELLRPVLTPTPQLAFGAALLRSGARVVAMDNSDGLGPSLRTLAQLNRVGASVDLGQIKVRHEVQLAATALGVDPLRLLFGWGDWNLVLAIDPGEIDLVRGISSDLAVPLTELGELTSSQDVVLRRGDRVARLAAPDSERFAVDSWFVAGIGSYIEKLLNFELP
ncbi:thiamine-phosphate kinase [soil metagenome]